MANDTAFDPLYADDIPASAIDWRATARCCWCSARALTAWLLLLLLLLLLVLLRIATGVVDPTCEVNGPTQGWGALGCGWHSTQFKDVSATRPKASIV